MYDLHNNIRRKRSISPVAIGTTGTGKTGVIVDTAGFESVEFEFDYGTITATNATITPTVIACTVTVPAPTVSTVASTTITPTVIASNDEARGVTDELRKKLPSLEHLMPKKADAASAK
mgnify:CR=1 FL=1